MSPRTKKQFAEIREVSIKKILDASLELFAKTGYEATTMSQIAKKAGVSKGLIYNYFDGKVELLKALIDQLQEGEEKLMETVHSEDPKQMLENIFRFFFQDLKERFEFWKMIASLSMQVEKFDFVHDVAVSKILGYFGFFEELLKQTGVSDPSGEAKVLAAMFDGIGLHFLIARDDYPIDEVEEYLIKKYCR